ncbi:response regulator transcription factor [uncultured Arcticibacterium sp.]|uniref:response regulator transcription factor n=1 Tax=uncultured Arcticibacterium sp. TaxID=2173042 RepID=UPI0030F64DBC
MNSLKILIVEDELITATDLQEILHFSGHAAFLAKNSSEALGLFNKELFDLVLCDIHLKKSDKNGIDLAREFRAINGVPVIFLTAHSEQFTFRQAKEVKPAAYIIKPFKEIELNYQIELAYLNAKMSQKDIAPLDSDSIYLPDRHEYIRIKKSEIICIQASGSYINFYMKGIKKPFQATMNLSYIEGFLQQPNFYRLSRFHILNMNFLKKFDAISVSMEEHPELSISIPKSKKSDFLNKVTVLKTPR